MVYMVNIRPKVMGSNGGWFSMGFGPYTKPQADLCVELIKSGAQGYMPPTGAKPADVFIEVREHEDPEDVIGNAIYQERRRKKQPANGQDGDGLDHWCTDEMCCNPPGYHHHENPPCPECGGEPYSGESNPRSRTAVNCFRCSFQWNPEPLAIEGVTP
jgi:hypothetical protein